MLHLLVESTVFQNQFNKYSHLSIFPTFALSKDQKMAQTVFYIIVGIIIFDYLLDRFLDYLNSTYYSNVLPKELQGIYDEEKYKKAVRNFMKV